MKRCLKCEGCKLFQQQFAAFGAAIAEAEDQEAMRASWNAYKEDNAEELRCTNSQ